MNCLALGTVQFGMSYGVANSDGKVSLATTKSILEIASSSYINTLDTAISYGSSEQCLGAIGVNNWRVVTKLPELPEKTIDVALWVNTQVEESLQRLNITKLAGLLLHRPEQLLTSEGKMLWRALNLLKEKGVVEKIGFSIYAPNELDLLYLQYKPDLVQVSYNIFDRRIKSSGWLEVMANDNVEVHVRSVFLQGLLLMNDIERPDKFNCWSELWESWNSWLQQQNITALEACLAFVMKEPHIEKVIVGVDSKSQLKEILSVLDSNITIFPDKFETNDINLINPSHWNSL